MDSRHTIVQIRVKPGIREQYKDDVTFSGQFEDWQDLYVTKILLTDESLRGDTPSLFEFRVKPMISTNEIFDECIDKVVDP